MVQMHKLADISLFESVTIFNDRTVDAEGNTWRNPNVTYSPQFAGTDTLIPNPEVEQLMEKAIEHCSAAFRSMSAIYQRDVDGQFFPRDKAKQCYEKLSALYNALVAIGDANMLMLHDDWDK